VDENEIIVHFVGRGEDRVYAPLTMNSLTGALRGQYGVIHCQRSDASGRGIGNCMLWDENEISVGSFVLSGARARRVVVFVREVLRGGLS
jgi:hypothetical protein